LRRLWLILWVGGTAAAAAPFSHRVHLGMGLECATCHAAAARSTSVEDNLLPAKSICLGCHTEAELPVPFPSPPSTNLTKFSHALHLKMGDVAPFLSAAIDHKTYLRTPGDRTDWIRPRLGTKNPCMACHRGLAESDRVTPAAMPQMADCLVCHTQIEAPFSCWDCHSQTADLQPASHHQIPHFMDAHSSGKLNLDETTCALCHGPNFRCMGCH
jgi:predicted CXXCH cytochrome family protein